MTPTTPVAPARHPRWRLALLVVALWTVPGLFSATQGYVSMRLEGEPVGFGRSLLIQLPGWYFWALATPAILALARRLPLDRARWRRAVPAHFAFSLLASAAHVALVVTLRKATMEIPLSWGALAVRYLVSYLHFDVVTYWAALGVGLAVLYYREAQERARAEARLQAQLAQARLDTLRMQLRPHFLFNALNAVAMLVREDERRQAVRMLAGLSELLRLSLDGDGAHEVPLREEMRLLERYLAIEEVRFQDRLRVRLDVPAELHEALVPNLILQPLVENAIRHGVARRAAAGLVEVEARAVGDRLRVTVRDDGPGLTAGAPGGTGVGLTNTRARLAQLYGAAQRFEVRDRAEGGVEAVLELPLRTGARVQGAAAQEAAAARGAPPDDSMAPVAPDVAILPSPGGPSARTR